MSLDQAHRKQARQIASELASIARTGKVLPGSIIERHTHCGRAGCACQGNPPRPHGPYWQWTRKVKNKTVSKWLSKSHGAEYKLWIENDRRIRELLSALEAIGIEHLEVEQRQQG
jgi:Family of unknown function (DUF6788)